MEGSLYQSHGGALHWACGSSGCARPKTWSNVFPVPQPLRPENRATPLEVTSLAACRRDKVNADAPGRIRIFHWSRPSCSMMQPARANQPNGYFPGSYRSATAPEPNSSRLTSLKSRHFDSPANKVGPWPASLGCTTNSYSSINPSSASASGSFTPPTSSPLPDSRLSC